MFYIAVMKRRDLDGAEAAYRRAVDSSDDEPARLAREALSEIETDTSQNALSQT